VNHTGNAQPRHASNTVDEQKVCPVTKAKLGSMGDPLAVEVEGRKVWVCCSGCRPKLKATPAKYLSKEAAQTAPSDAVLSVPESAVIDAGDRKVVYVETEPGVFEGRAIVVGSRIGDRFPVLDGLAPGDRVAAAGAFLIDAESRLNSGAVAAHSHREQPSPPKTGRTEFSAAKSPPTHVH
jgi:Cu(I)/Ag(I) efflux system membrane fusion protein